MSTRAGNAYHPANGAVEEQWNEKKQAASKLSPAAAQPQTPPSVADELAELAALKQQGVLSDEEVAIQKRKLLS
jgi:hypothetical protein